MKKLFSYFDETYGAAAFEKLRNAATKYLVNESYFSRQRGWPFCDFSNNPVPWAEPLPVPGLEEWEAILSYIKRYGMNSDRPLTLSEKGRAALNKIGGRRTIGMATPWSAENVIKKQFLAFYFDLDKTDK